MRHVVGIGASHLRSVTSAATDLLTTRPDGFSYTPICFADPEYSPPFIREGNTQIANPAWARTLRELTSRQQVQVLFHLPGAEWWHWSLTPGPCPYDFVDPYHDDGTPFCGQVIPFDLFRARARAAFRPVQMIIDTVRGVADVPMTLLPPPPPVRSLSETFARFAAGDFSQLSLGTGQRALLGRLSPTIEQYGISSSAFRLKVWRASMRVVQDICEETGVSYMAPDDGALDPDGFLRSDMVSDFVHANRAWGLLHLNRFLTRSPKNPEVI